MSNRARVAIMIAGLTFCASATIGLSGCASSEKEAAGEAFSEQELSLRELKEWMTGSFTSAAQAERDPENFVPVELHMQPIWTQREDGPWLYVEQALAQTPERPYRQRVYRLGTTDDGLFTSEVYTMPRPERFIGAHEQPERLDALSPDELDKREGCTIYLTRQSNRLFVGGTRGEGCESSLRGAAYATSDVMITPYELRSWDRGFDAGGEQVWGAEKGGYVFVKE